MVTCWTKVDFVQTCPGHNTQTWTAWRADGAWPQSNTLPCWIDRRRGSSGTPRSWLYNGWRSGWRSVVTLSSSPLQTFQKITQCRWRHVYIFSQYSLTVYPKIFTSGSWTTSVPQPDFNIQSKLVTDFSFPLVSESPAGTGWWFKNRWFRKPTEWHGLKFPSWSLTLGGDHAVCVHEKLLTTTWREQTKKFPCTQWDHGLLFCSANISKRYSSGWGSGSWTKNGSRLAKSG